MWRVLVQQLALLVLPERRRKVLAKAERQVVSWLRED
jgi:hypothetical protein